MFGDEFHSHWLSAARVRSGKAKHRKAVTTSLRQCKDTCVGGDPDVFCVGNNWAGRWTTSLCPWIKQTLRFAGVPLFGVFSAMTPSEVTRLESQPVRTATVGTPTLRHCQQHARFCAASTCGGDLALLETRGTCTSWSVMTPRGNDDFAHSRHLRSNVDADHWHRTRTLGWAVAVLVQLVHDTACALGFPAELLVVTFFSKKWRKKSKKTAFFKKTNRPTFGAFRRYVHSLPVEVVANSMRKRLRRHFRWW